MIDSHMAVLEKKYSLVYLTPSKPQPSLRSVFRFSFFKRIAESKRPSTVPRPLLCLKKGSKKKTPVKAVFGPPSL